MRQRLLWVILLTAALCWPVSAATPPLPTLQEVEKKMVQGGYLDTLSAAKWAAAQGEAIVPLLAQLLENRQKYAKEQGGATGAFPFNVLWALGHIPGSGSLKALEKYYAATKDPSAALAMQGWRLRLSEGSRRCGVLAREGLLLEGPDGKSRVLKRLKPGQQVKILHERNPNHREVGPRGGPMFYDRVDLIPSGTQGYIPRAGDDFTPFM